MCYVFVNGFHAVKMFHLSAASHQDVPSFDGGSHCIVCVCVCVHAYVVCVCTAHLRMCVYMYMYMCVGLYVCVRAYVMCMYVRVYIVCVCRCAYVMLVFMNVFNAVKIFHLSAASHQDVPSFNGGNHCMYIHVHVCVYHC